MNLRRVWIKIIILGHKFIELGVRFGFGTPGDRKRQSSVRFKSRFKSDRTLTFHGSRWICNDDLNLTGLCRFRVGARSRFGAPVRPPGLNHGAPNDRSTRRAPVATPRVGKNDKVRSDLNHRYFWHFSQMTEHVLSYLTLYTKGREGWSIKDIYIYIYR